jgi:hypothetical protein
VLTSEDFLWNEYSAGQFAKQLLFDWVRYHGQGGQYLTIALGLSQR